MGDGEWIKKKASYILGDQTFPTSDFFFFFFSPQQLYFYLKHAMVIISYYCNQLFSSINAYMYIGDKWLLKTEWK